ncbi:NlpC/P60 family protein [Clostridium sp.]|uniref:C40 family peptidase n=1 Tax=Clostridium sp. TaxID=1506 RepID=UPI002FCC8D25
MKKNLRIFIATLTLVTAMSTPVFATPISGQAQNQQLEDKIFKITQKIEKYDMEIEHALDEIQNNEKQLKTIQEETLLTEDTLNLIEKELENEQQLFNKRMRAMYISGFDVYLDVLFKSKGFSDLLTRVSALNNIIKFNNEIIASVKLKQEDLNIKQNKLNEERTKLLTLNQENTRKIANFEATKVEQSKLIDEIKQQETLLVSEADESLLQLASTNQRASRGGEVPSSSNEVLQYAYKFLGTPYVWGGTTPSGFDCSGFTQYVYKNFGVSLGRTTKHQIKNGVGISRSELQPGDLVFYGEGGVPNHMGIYVGNGKYIHSPQTGDVVKISNYDRPDYITARRVMN